MQGHSDYHQPQSEATSELISYPSTNRLFSPKPVSVMERLPSRFIDMVIFNMVNVLALVIVLLILSLLLFLGVTSSASPDSPLRDFEGMFGLFEHHYLLYMMSYVVLFLYEFLFLARFRGTPGKLIFGFRVVDATTYKFVSVQQAFMRTAVLVLPLAVLHVGWSVVMYNFAPGGIGIRILSMMEFLVFVVPIVIAFSRIHEKLSGTIVIRGTKPNSVPA